MVEIIKMKDDIVKVMLGWTIIMLLTSFFIQKTTMLMIGIIGSIIFCITYIIILKYSYIFDSDKKIFKGLSKVLDSSYNLGRKK